MKRCPACGKTYTNDMMRFCLKCGTTLDATDASSQKPAPVVQEIRKESTGQSTPPPANYTNNLQTPPPSPTTSLYNGEVSADPPQKGSGKKALIVFAVLLVLAIIAFASITLLCAAKVLGNMASNDVDPSQAASVAPSEDHFAENIQPDSQPGNAIISERNNHPDEALTDPPPTEPIKTIIKHYTICAEAVTWEEANQRCLDKGGHLAYITSREELDSILTEANKTDLRFLWVGAKTTISGSTVKAEWLDGSPFTFVEENQLWYPGEPSGRDMTADDHVIEPYVMLWKVKDVWSFNDNSNVCLKEYKSYRIGYICEIDEEVYE